MKRPACIKTYYYNIYRELLVPLVMTAPDITDTLHHMYNIIFLEVSNTISGLSLNASGFFVLHVVA